MLLFYIKVEHTTDGREVGATIPQPCCLQITPFSLLAARLWKRRCI